jgi:SAM-dependent methyltransferase
VNNQEAEIVARDNSADESEEWYVKNKGKYHNEIEINNVLRYLKPKAEDNILDAGSGTGRITRILAKKCRKIYALDFSKKSLEVLAQQVQKESIHNVVYISANLAQEFELDEKVEKAVSVQVIQHIPTESGRQKAVKNVYNSLKNGGTFVMVAYNWNNRIKKSLLKEGTFDNGIFYFRFTPEEIKSLFEKCGFENILVAGCNNFQVYSIFGENKILTKFLYPVMLLDMLISKFSFSTKIGVTLICLGFKR